MLPIKTHKARFFAVPESHQRKTAVSCNQLFKKYSTMAQEKVFSDTFSTTALAVYESFESAETLANMDLSSAHGIHHREREEPFSLIPIP